MSECIDEVFTQEAGLVCSKTVENIKLKNIIERYGENVSYYNGELAGSWREIKKDADSLLTLIESRENENERKNR